MIGSSLSHFEITAKLGEGGMGEVYRARDTKLGRDVAIKVLPAAFTTDSERFARFEREAQLLASLNHPNIAAIYDLAEDDGVHYLVLELAEGEDLSRWLARGPMPVEEALSIALEIARALESAHERSIVHRDLKPANVAVSSSGSVKVLDFGLAKAWEGSTDQAFDLSKSPTLTAQMTEAGVILGTAAYMSPEQAKGRPTDRRTDIWSFGVVVWEMLTGRQLFRQDTVPETMAAVLREDIDLGELPETTPGYVRRLLARCLDRNPLSRLRDIGEARVALETGRDGAEGEISLASPSAGVAESTRLSWVGRLPWIATAVFAALAASLGWLWLTRPVSTAPVVRSLLEIPSGLFLEAGRGFELSPDGTRLVFGARDTDGLPRLFVLHFRDKRALPLTGTEEPFAPFWSPDGEHIAFFSGEKLKRVPADGGAVRTIAEGITNPKGGDWGPHGRIAYTPAWRSGMLEVSAEGGESRVLTTLDAADGEQSHRWPRYLPGDGGLLFLVQTAEAGAEDDRSRLEVLDTKGIRHPILQINASGAFVPPQDLFFLRNGSVYRQTLALERWALEGEARVVADEVGLTHNEWSTFTVSKEAGLLAYHREQSLPWQLEWRDRSGRLLSQASPEGEFAMPALGPRGRRVAYVEDILSIWILDLTRGTTTRLVSGEVDLYSPSWSPDGEWLAYAADEDDGTGSLVLRRRASGVGESEVLYESEGTNIFGTSWSPDGRWIAFEDGEGVFRIDLESGQTERVVDTEGWNGHAEFSPDGRWMAYASTHSGRDEVYLVPAGDLGARWQVSNGGGVEPHWSSDGRELYYRGLDYRLFAVEVDASGTDPQLGSPEPLFSIPDARAGVRYEVGSDGLFLLRRQPGATRETFELIQNWPALFAAP